jgi:hypothetical protein
LALASARWLRRSAFSAATSGSGAFSACAGRPARRRSRRGRRRIRHLAVGDEQQFVGAGAQQVAVVRDEDHAALVILHGEGQGLAHFEVEVVGRLVEQQQVGLGADQQGQRQARLFAAGEGLDGARRHVAAVEAAEVVAQFLFRRQRFEAAMCCSGDSSGRSCSSWCWAK